MPDASDEELRSTYGSHDASTVVYCHIHAPFVRRLDDLTVANSGSVGWLMDGDWHPSYLEGVMNLLRNGLLRRKTGDRHGAELTE